MRTSKFFFSSVAAVALVSVIGFSYAQNTKPPVTDPTFPNLNTPARNSGSTNAAPDSGSSANPSGGQPSNPNTLSQGQRSGSGAASTQPTVIDPTFPNLNTPARTSGSTNTAPGSRSTASPSGSQPSNSNTLSQSQRSGNDATLNRSSTSGSSTGSGTSGTLSNERVARADRN